ncbi:hypothetical protein [Nocardioides pyridinolyticus]
MLVALGGDLAQDFREPSRKATTASASTASPMATHGLGTRWVAA